MVDTDLSADAEESAMSLEAMVPELDRGGTVILDASSAVAENVRRRLHREELAQDIMEKFEDEKSYFSIPSADGRSPDAEGSLVTVNLERGTWDDLRAGEDSSWVRGSESPFTCKHGDGRFSFELCVQPFYKEEGDDVTLKLILSTIMWNSVMKDDEKKRRGPFVDTVHIDLTPMWKEDDRSPKKFLPASSANDIAQDGIMSQTTIGGMGSYSNPMITASVTRGTSEVSTARAWRERWKKGSDGSATFIWSLNLWYPISGGSALYKVEEFEAGKTLEKANWKNFTDVPKLPPAYSNGEFAGFDYVPSVEWRVKRSTFRSNKMSWKMEIKVRASYFHVVHGKMDIGKLMKPLRSLEWKDSYVKIVSGSPITLAPSSNAPSVAFHMWIIYLVVALVIVLVAWELYVRDFFL